MNDETGATSVETVITILPFLLFVFGIIQLCLVAYAAFTLQFSVNSTLRWGIIEETLVPGEDRFTSIKNHLTVKLQNMGINTTNLRVYMCEGVPANCKGNNAGTSNSFVTLQATVPAPSVLGWNFSVTGKAAAKNEPF